MNHNSFQYIFTLWLFGKLLFLWDFHVFPKVQFLRELELIVELYPLVGFHIKHHPHQVNNQNVRERVKAGGSDDAFSFAELTKIVIDGLLFSKPRQTLIEGLVLFDFQLEIIEILNFMLLFVAFRAPDGYDGFTPVDSIDEVAEAGVFELCLYS